MPALIEVRLPQADGTAAVILGKAPVLGASHLRGSDLPKPLPLRCDVVAREDDTVLVRLRHGVTDQHGRNTFRVSAGAVRPENPAEIFDHILMTYHVDPDNVTDVESAWLAFTEFTQTELDGLAPGPDADGVIVHWGRYSWNDRTATLTFTRRLALPTDHGRPVFWQVSLDMRFPGFHTLATGNSGVDVTPPGPDRAAALTRIRAAVTARPLLDAMWHGRPVASCLTFDPTD